MVFSVGGYSIDNYKVDAEQESYTVDLLKDGVKIATVHDSGDGYDDIDYVNIPEGHTESYYSYILQDMYNLIESLKDVVEAGGLFMSFLHSQYAATKGFAILLLDLKGLVDKYDEIPSKDDGDYFIVGAFGHSYYTNKTMNRQRSYFWRYTLTRTYPEAYRHLKSYANNNSRVKGELVAAAVLNGEIDWNLTIEDYSELYKP